MSTLDLLLAGPCWVANHEFPADDLKISESGWLVDCQNACCRPRIVEPHLYQHQDLSMEDSPIGALSESRRDIDVGAKTFFRKKSKVKLKLAIAQTVRFWQKHWQQTCYVVCEHASLILGVGHDTLRKVFSNGASLCVPVSWYAVETIGAG